MSAAQKHNLVLVRHGRSIANEENRIISDPINGAIGDNDKSKVRYGLSPAGKAMVTESASSLADYIAAYSKEGVAIRVKIVCSPFDRTRDTAAIMYKGLQEKLMTGRVDRQVEIQDPEADQGLVERYFGDFEGQAPSSELYESVWKLDARDPSHNEYGVESLEQVVRRQRRVMRMWGCAEFGSSLAGGGMITTTEQHQQLESWIVYVGHGDPLQILQTNMRGWALERHREMPHHEVAEWRHVEWCSSLAPNYCIAPIDPECRAKALGQK